MNKSNRTTQNSTYASSRVHSAESEPAYLDPSGSLQEPIGGSQKTIGGGIRIGGETRQAMLKKDY